MGEAYKTKINGMKVLVRDQDESERILPNSMHSPFPIMTQQYYPSMCVGELICHHAKFRKYIEVLSPWFVTGSNDSMSEEEFC